MLVLARENVGNFHRICRDSVAVRVYSVDCIIQFRIFKVFPTTVTRGVVNQYHASFNYIYRLKWVLSERKN